MSPKAKLPVPHFVSEKSSVTDDGRVASEFVLETFAVFELVFEFELRLARELGFATFVLLFEFEPMLARARSMITRPIPITPTTSTPPRIHQTAFDFLRGCIVNGGAHC